MRSHLWLKLMPARRRREFSLSLLAVLCLTCVASAQSGGSVRMSGGVTEFVTLSIPQGAEAPGAGVRVNVSRNADQSLTITLSGTSRELTGVSIHVQIRSNTGYKLFAKAQVCGSNLSSLSVVNAHATGSLVDAAAAETLSVAPMFDARPGTGNLTPARGLDRPNLSALTELLSGPRISLGGTLMSPHNALQVTLSMTVEPRGDDRVWTTEVLLSAAPAARF